MSRGRILVIDDERSLREFLTILLEQEGYEVATADTVASGIETVLDGSFDLVTLFDVLYHRSIHDDGDVLSETSRILKTGGHLLLTDSAFNFLLSKHDLAFHARERYNRNSLIRRLESAGLSIVKISYFNFFLFPAVALVRLFEKRRISGDERPESNLHPMNSALNGILKGIMKSEARLLRRFNLPFGSSILCLARKSETEVESHE